MPVRVEPVPRKTGGRRTRTGAGGAFWMWGRHAVAAARANPRRVVRRVLSLEDGAGRGAEIVDRRTLAGLLPEGAVHQGVALLAEPLEDPGIEALCAAAAARERAAVVVLDRVQDPRNVGAILRSAAAFGAIGAVLPDRHAPRESGVLAKAAAGALETVPIVRAANLARALAAMKAAGSWCVGLDADAPDALAPETLPSRTCLVLGAEGRGLRRLTAERCDLLARIPMAGGAASLNVAAAAAIALHVHASLRRDPGAAPLSPGRSTPAARR